MRRFYTIKNIYTISLPRALFVPSGDGILDKLCYIICLSTAAYVFSEKKNCLFINFINKKKYVSSGAAYTAEYNDDNWCAWICKFVYIYV